MSTCYTWVRRARHHREILPQILNAREVTRRLVTPPIALRHQIWIMQPQCQTHANESLRLLGLLHHRKRWRHRLQQRKTQCDTRPAQHGTAGEMLLESEGAHL